MMLKYYEIMAEKAELAEARAGSELKVLLFLAAAVQVHNTRLVTLPSQWLLWVFVSQRLIFTNGDPTQNRSHYDL